MSCSDASVFLNTVEILNFEGHNLGAWSKPPKALTKFFHINKILDLVVLNLRRSE